MNGRAPLQWGPAEWTYDPNRTVYPNFQLILDFRRSKLQGGQNHLLNHLGQLFETQSMVDVQFVVQGETIGGHANILSSASSVLTDLFQEQFRERSVEVFPIEDIKFDVFKEMVQFIYTGTVSNLDEYDEDLFLAADKYKIEALKMQCEQSLCGKVNIDNVFKYFTLSHLHAACRLAECCRQCIADNRDIAWTHPQAAEFNKNYPELFFNVMATMHTTKK